jgi:hypothetical protein
MSVTYDKRILLSQAPFAWIYPLLKTDAVDPEDPPVWSLDQEWLYDNIQQTTLKFPALGSGDSGETIDINRGDSAIIRFTKSVLVLDGVSGLDITPADAQADATGEGEISFTINETPTKTTTNFTGHANYIDTLKAKRGERFLVVVPMGWTAVSMATGTPDGYAYMIGKINSDIDLTFGGEPTSHSITFVSYKTPTFTKTVVTAGTPFTAQTWKRGSDSQDVTGIKPALLTSGEADDLILGKIVVKQNASYS